MAPDEKKEQLVEVLLNGRKVEIEKRRWSYEQFLELAFPGEPVLADFQVAITYSLPRQHDEGLLQPGESMEVKKGMVINVKRTLRS